jgi:hypothetical protein
MSGVCGTGMFKDDMGHKMENGRAIFPPVAFNKKLMAFKCIGTGFFIQQTDYQAKDNVIEFEK